MSLPSQHYARLSDDSYKAPRWDSLKKEYRGVEIDGIEYKPIEHMDRPSGYQGTTYQRVDTGEIVVAHRGTEFDREAVRDGALADGGMVLNRANLQASDAVELTRRALEHAKKYATENSLSRAPEVSVTGHSLGGCLAQITAHHFDLRGDTFNAYGAASLGYRVPAGGEKVLNHVMASDVVSAGGQHYGRVRVYAMPAEIAALQQAGYENTRSRIDARNPLNVVGDALKSYHGMHNFIDFDANNEPDRSVLNNPATRLLADHYDPMIDKYRADILVARESITFGARLRDVPGMARDVIDGLRGPLPAGHGRSEHAPAATAPESPLIPPSLRGPSGLYRDLPEWRSPQSHDATGRTTPEAASARTVSPHDDPRHPHHELYAELKQRLPQASEDRLAQFAAACHMSGIKPGNLGDIQAPSADRIVFLPARVAGGTLAQVDLSAPPPAQHETLRQVDAYDRQTQWMAQSQEAQRHSEGRSHQGPALG